LNSKKDYKRKISLGELGELLAIKALVDNGFEKIMNLNDEKRNHAFADLYAKKNGEKMIISVKTRNKYRKRNNPEEELKLNAYYNLLYNNGMKKVDDAKRMYKAIPYWMAIQLDRFTYSIFLGSLNELEGKKSISLKKCEAGKIGKCFVANKQHFFDYSYFGNQN